MMLPPFRIRDLCGQARHGVVQITIPQYDSTLQSHPDAALRYLDEDDGETITVGSGFELGQRLEDPVPQHKAAAVDVAQVNDYSTSKHLHTFDIERTSHSVAAWMDHEAYSSKSLRSLSRSSTTSANDAHGTDSVNPGSFVQVSQPVEEVQGPLKPVHPSGESAEATELDMYEEMYDKEVQNPMPVSTGADASVQVSDNHLTAHGQENADAVEKIVSDAMEGLVSNLDSHFDTLADFLQNTSQALRVVAEKTRESDTNAVESILSGFNAIFGEVGKLAKAVLDIAEEASTASPAELDLPQVYPPSCAKIKAKEEVTTKSKDNELSASVEIVSDIADLPSPVFASTPRPVVRVETLPAQQPRVPAPYHSGTELTARLPISQLDKLYHIPSKSFIENQPQEVSAEKDQMFTNLERGGFNPESDRTWKHMPLPDDDQLSKTKKKVDFALPNGTLRPRETAKSSLETFPRSILDLEASDPDFSARFPPLMSVRRSKTMESLRQRSQSPDNRMRSRQDALKRFPSLGQLERRNVQDDHIRDRKEDNTRNVTRPGRAIPEAIAPSFSIQRPDRACQQAVYDASTRQWSIPDFSMTDRDIGQRTDEIEKLISHLHRACSDILEAMPIEPVKNVFTRQSDEVEEVIAAVGRDITEASNEVRRLPGAWPEALADSKTALPTSNESSGAFFDRMTRQIASSDKRQHKTVEESYFNEWPLSGYHDHRGKHKVKHLERAKSVATLNPSATLTTPFDPLMPSGMVVDSPAGTEDFRMPQGKEEIEAKVHSGFETFFNSSLANTIGQQSSNNAQQPFGISKEAHSQGSSKQDGVRRSATEKMPHRRPYSHRYSGAGRLPWENFEDRSFDLRTSSFVQRHERARRAVDRPAPPQPVVYDAATRPWNVPEISTRKPSIKPAARQNPTHPIRLPSDLHERVNNYRSGIRHRASLPAMGLARQSKINDCIQQLKDMGFGKEDRNEASRLSVYAAATGGDIFEAVEMIEEDRKAGASLRGRRQTTGPENGPGGWL